MLREEEENALFLFFSDIPGTTISTHFPFMPREIDSAI